MRHRKTCAAQFRRGVFDKASSVGSSVRFSVEKKCECPSFVEPYTAYGPCRVQGNNSERPGTLPVSVLLQRAPVLLASIHLLSYFIFVVFND